MKKKKSTMTLSTKLAAASMVVLMTIGIAWILSVVYSRHSQLPILGEPGHVAGRFSFRNQDGNLLTEKSVENKVTLVEYFFTSCPSICPVMNKNLKQVYERFKGNSEFMILSHTVDPERDSVAALKKYAKRFDGSTPGWQFLTGSKDSLYEAASRDYLLSAVDTDSSSFIHTQYIALLDRKRRIRGFYDFTNPENVLKADHAIERLLKED